ncbi:phage minor head protein [Sphingobacterium griseoflavum]|uniref:Phage head morphogenesis domain-containing protein n=1 Tax=Sphingobacterium griseoflavum TaxID=1474952 RepID=A0ABQ3HU71_9SPHI|nr:phage minor head protein [Sphingobacterium griseoflavum]GHE34846.1 hypothetical protein GCM10017764_17540 [Sphingobacterium griseoflavum]
MTPKQKLHRARLQENRKILAYERRYTKIILTALNEQVKQAIDSRGSMSDQPMYDALAGLYRVVAFDFVKHQYNLLDRRLKTKNVSFFINTWRTWIEAYVFTELAKKVADINETTRNKVREAISIGLDQGLEWDKIAKLIQDKVGTLGKSYRALMIARTEVSQAINMAKTKSSDDWEQETGERMYKIWIHRYANSPRDWHLALDNNIAIPKEQDFEVVNPKTGTREMMAFPHSPRASRENTINCSCTVMYMSYRFAKYLANNS